MAHRRSRLSPYDRVARVYDLVMDSWHGHYDWCARVAHDHLGAVQNAIVLDVGGGTGGVAALLAARGAQPLVLDRSHGLLRRARGRRLAATTGDAVHLPYGDGAADVVVFCQVLHHIVPARRTVAALQEAHRVLRPAGRLLIYELDPPVTLAARAHLWLEQLLFGPVRCWPRHALLGRLTALGFTITWPADPTVATPYVVLATKPAPSCTQQGRPSGDRPARPLTEPAMAPA